MRLGFIGGTVFVGRHMVASALERGHDVTLFHRGQTGADLFPDAEHVLGDRAHDLAKLRGRRFDALIDVCAYRPREVHAVADVLGDEIGRYLYVSSVSAYRPDGDGPLDEDSPLLGPDDLDDPATDVVDGKTYGPLEAMSEVTARERFGDRSTVLRPTYVVGPHDHTDRFTSWVRRCSGGGPVLAGGPPHEPVQVIDARDLGQFAISLVESGVTGAFNGLGPAQAIDWASLLEQCIATVGHPGTQIIWADADRVRELGMDPEEIFPMWGSSDEAVLSRCLPTKSIAAGLRLRPLSETIRDLHAWDVERGLPPLKAGLDSAAHDDLLAALRPA